MSAYREVILFCDGQDEPTEGNPHGRHCGVRFRPDPNLGFISAFTTMRREAAKAGWTSVRYPGRLRSLDKDFCPKHKPEGN